MTLNRRAKLMQSRTFLFSVVSLSLVRILYKIHEGKAIIHSSSKYIPARKARHHLKHVSKAFIESGNLKSYDEQNILKMKNPGKA